MEKVIKSNGLYYEICSIDKRKNKIPCTGERIAVLDIEEMKKVGHNWIKFAQCGR